MAEKRGYSVLGVLGEPVETIKIAVSEKNWGKTFLLIILSSVFIAITGYSMVDSLGLGGLGSGAKAVAGILIGSFVGMLIFALLFKITLNIFSEKGGYYEALTSLGLGTFVLTLGLAIYSLLGYVPAGGTIGMVILIVIKMLVVGVGFAMGSAVIIKSGAEMFKTSIVNVAIALGVVYSSVYISIYLGLIQYYIQLMAGMSGAGLGAGALGY